MMGLETGVNYINDLVSTNPTGTDPKGQGDDHIRNSKRAAKQTFPGFLGAVAVSGPETGSANAYVLTPATPLVSYVAGMTARFMATNANTGACTLNISGLGVKALKSSVGDDLGASEIDTVGYVDAVYDGSRFLLRGPTTQFVEQQAISAVLPGQGGNSGKFLTTDGSTASWGYAGITGYAAITTNHTVLTTEREKLLESTASTGLTYALPAAASAGAQFAFYANASAAGAITLDPDASELINGAATYVLRAGEGGLVFCDGTAWHVFPGHNTGAEDLAMFGDGADGDVTVTGAVTLSRDMYYNNLTLASGAALVTAGWRIFVKNTLDLTAAPAGAIQWNGNAGGDAAGLTAGGAGASLPSGMFAGTITAAASGSSTTAGAAGAALFSNGGKGGASGATSLRSAVPVAAQVSYPVRRADVFLPQVPTAATATSALMGGGTGSAGSSDGGGAGAGGGGATGGGAMAIYARIVSRGVSTAAGSVQAKGAAGGRGGSTAAGSTTGGGGAGGSGGGWIYFVYRFAMGATATGLFDVTGGNGGRGGDGFGGGAGADGAESGQGGRIQVYNLALGTLTEVTPAAAVAGAAHSASTGGSGGAATTSRLNL